MLAITAGHPLRTTPIPEEVLTVAAVVLGEEQHQLTGWQLDDAVAAMTALGDSGTHIAWWLRVPKRIVQRNLADRGLRANRFDRRLDIIGIALAATGSRIRLLGNDRVVAINLLARQGMTSGRIAHRLMVNTPTEIRAIAKRYAISIVDHDAGHAEVRAFRVRHDTDQSTLEPIAA